MKPHLIVALDLESNQPSGRIIQVGAVLGNLRTGNVISEFNEFVNPHEELTPRITDLTGIAQKDVAHAPELHEVYDRLVTWLAPYKKQRFLNPLVWGGHDAEDLRGQLGEDPETWIFGRRYIDAKTVYVAWRTSQGHTGQGGLAKSLPKIGLSFQGTAHNALDDAKNTFLIYVEILKRFSGASFQSAG